MLNLVLLAAGNSRRFGENKLMWPVNGKPMVRHIMDILNSIAIEKGWSLIVVTQEGPVADIPRAACAKTVINTMSDEGISTSIRLAIESMENSNCPAVFFVADQPFITRQTILDFVEGYASSGKGLGCVAHNGETGNPCAFAPGYFPELLALKGDRGGKKVIMQHTDDLYMFETANGDELTDIDTKDR